MFIANIVENHSGYERFFQTAQMESPGAEIVLPLGRGALPLTAGYPALYYPSYWMDKQGEEFASG